MVGDLNLQAEADSIFTNSFDDGVPEEEQVRVPRSASYMDLAKEEDYDADVTSGADSAPEHSRRGPRHVPL